MVVEFPWLCLAQVPVLRGLVVPRQVIEKKSLPATREVSSKKDFRLSHDLEKTGIADDPKEVSTATCKWMLQVNARGRG